MSKKVVKVLGVLTGVVLVYCVLDYVLKRNDKRLAELDSDDDFDNVDFEDDFFDEEDF